MGTNKDKDEDKHPSLPVTEERLARIVAAEKKTFQGKGTEVRK